MLHGLAWLGSANNIPKLKLVLTVLRVSPDPQNLPRDAVVAIDLEAVAIANVESREPYLIRFDLLSPTESQ